jgi:hypothetical protein
MPFPLPTASYTKIEAKVQVNGVSDKTGWAAFITPASQFVLVGSGEHNIFMPVKYTPTEAGTVEFVFTIHSPVGTNTVRKTVKVFDPVNTSETVGT